MEVIDDPCHVIERHGGWIWRNEPYRKEPVLRALREARQPLLLREVVDRSGVASVLAANVLRRAVKKGVVTRRKVKMTTHAFCRTNWKILPSKARRLMWLYYWVDE